MEGPIELSERQMRRLEQRFNELYWTFLERKCRKALRREIDPLEAVQRICTRFCNAIRKGNPEVLMLFQDHGVDQGLILLAEHRYFKDWCRWEITDAIRRYYRNLPKRDFEPPSGRTAPDDEPEKWHFVSTDVIAELADDAPDAEEILDGEPLSRPFLERILEPLITARLVSRRNADIFLDRHSGFLLEGDKADRKPRRHSLEEIGKRHNGLSTSQVDRIVKQVADLLSDPEAQRLVRDALGRPSDPDAPTYTSPDAPAGTRLNR